MQPFIYGGLWMSKLHKLDYQSPIGILEIIGTEEAVVSILFSENDEIKNVRGDDTPKVLELCYLQLDEYFKGERRESSFTYQLEGTYFQKSEWNVLKEMTYGETGYYKDIDALIVKDIEIRAVW